jgi:hypothetical protein
MENILTLYLVVSLGVLLFVTIVAAVTFAAMCSQVVQNEKRFSLEDRQMKLNFKEGKT